MKTIIMITILTPMLAFAAMKTTKYHKDGTQTVDFGEFKDRAKNKEVISTSCRYDNGREVSATSADYAGCTEQVMGTQRMNSLERGAHRFEARTGGSSKFEFQVGR